MLTPEQLAEIEVRADAATAGPWQISIDDFYIESTTVFDDVNEPTHDREPRLILETLPDADADTTFIAAARADVPALLAHIREQDARIAAAREAASKPWWEYREGDCGLAVLRALEGSS